MEGIIKANMKVEISKYQKPIIWALCIAAVIGCGIYYFGVLSAVMPNTEEVMATQRWYQILKFGQPYRHVDIVFDAAGLFSVLIGGMSFFACRMQFALLYTTIAGLSLWLCMSKCGSERRWSVLPLWAFFMIFVHTARPKLLFSRLYESEDWILQIPYHYHTSSVIFALICILLVQGCLNAGTVKKKRVMGAIGLVTGIYAFLYTDLIYYLVFVIPFLIVMVLKGLYHDKIRKYIMPLFCLGVGVVLLTRILPGALSDKLWGRESVGLYGGIYGATNWLDLDNILSYFVNYIKTVMQLFNIELSNYPVISLYSVLFVVRIAFVALGYVIVGKIIACSVKGKAYQNGYTMIDEIVAWAFVILSCSFLFTSNGVKSDGIRYYGALVPLLVILLCRNVEEYLKKLLPELGKMKYKRFYFAGMITALCICQAEPVWQYQPDDSYQEDCEAVIEWFRLWEAENDGYALAPYWICGRLSAMTEGKILFYHDEDMIRQIYGEDADIRFAVVGWDVGILQWNYDIEDGSKGYDEWSENYKDSIRRAVDLDHVYVCEFTK